MNEALRAVLAAVESGPCHSLASRSLRGARREAAMFLVALGDLALLPKRGRFPKRFVVTANGSHALGTFDATGDLATEVYQARVRALSALRRGAA